MESTLDERVANRAVVSAYSSQHAIHDVITRDRQQQGTDGEESANERPPAPSSSRLASSHNERPFPLKQFLQGAEGKSNDETILYLAYGSNLAASKFKGDRGIKPLSQINVQVPALRLTFDLPGIPYAEPCFANTAIRDPNADPPEQLGVVSDHEKAQPWGASFRKEDYRKSRWHKGLIGVVYEVTPKDYAHIIATEGGGAGYQDIVVDCHPFASADPNQPVPQNPTLPPFKAHTLFAPAIPDDEGPPSVGGHLQRMDPDYAQPSARYLKLLTDGAAESKLPYEYQEYLLSIRSYEITTLRQRAGQVAFAATWVMVVLLVFALSKLFVDDNGRLPEWLARLHISVFAAAWKSYDHVFRPAFGDGERTIGEDEEGVYRRRQRTS